MKFCHFNKHITSLNFTDEHLLKPVTTKENFYKLGKWNRDRWTAFESFLDEHFKPEFQWRTKCTFLKDFINSDRTYFTVSFGFTTDLFVPYKIFQDLDKNPVEYTQVSRFIDDVIDSFSTLLD